jgi:hypothetical protein
MKRFTIVLLLSVLFSSPAHAFTAGSGLFTDLEFVAETQIPGADQEAISLCYVTRDFRILGFTLTSDILGYALSNDGCIGQVDRAFSAQQMETAQSLNLIDKAVPAVARNSMERNLQNYGIWVALSLGLIAVIIRRIKSIMGLDLRGPMRKKASQRILTALCYVGKCDGIVASNEIALIAKTAERVTRRKYLAADIIRMTDSIDMNLSEQDFIDFGKGLRDSEKDMMMRGAFYVALASGRILPAEHEFLSEMAHGIGMPGEDFRRVMNLAIADLDTYPPNL